MIKEEQNEDEDMVKAQNLVLEKDNPLITDEYN